jgi:hypothetical protein
VQRVIPAVVGVVAGVASHRAMTHLPKSRQRQVSAAGLAGAALIYVGGAARAGSSRQFVACLAAGIPYSALAVAALQASPPQARRLLAGGWLAHAAVDWTHQRLHGSAVPEWYPAMCLGFDVAFAGATLTQPA